MRIKDLKLHLSVNDRGQYITLLNQDNHGICSILWGEWTERTKSQAIAIAKRLCDRFNSGQEEK